MRLTEIRRDPLMRMWGRYEAVDGGFFWEIRNQHLLHPGEDPIAPAPCAPRAGRRPSSLVRHASTVSGRPAL